MNLISELIEFGLKSLKILKSIICFDMLTFLFFVFVLFYFYVCFVCLFLVLFLIVCLCLFAFCFLFNLFLFLIMSMYFLHLGYCNKKILIFCLFVAAFTLCCGVLIWFSTMTKNDGGKCILVYLPFFCNTSTELHVGGGYHPSLDFCCKDSDSDDFGSGG